MPVDCGYIDCFISGVCSGHNNPDYNPQEISTPTQTFDNGSTQINNYGTFYQGTSPPQEHNDNTIWSHQLNVTTDILPLLVVIVLIAIVAFVILT
jgi:hypothetical protein